MQQIDVNVPSSPLHKRVGEPDYKKVRTQEITKWKIWVQIQHGGAKNHWKSKLPLKYVETSPIVQ